mmetsp:Transcript_20553/g.48540  ORF Transcript_20553/g.48540 Transcript_20553/m.48540 type:complete len:368 (+) Transcript_20553:145-1248(+)
MVKASVTTADKPGVDSAAAHKTLNFGATPPPSKARALHGTVVNIRKVHLVSLLVVAICAGNVLTTPLLSMFQTFSHVLDNDSSILYNIAQKHNTVQSGSQEEDLNKELLEDDDDYDYVDWEYGDDNAVEPESELELELELEPEPKFKGLADVIHGGLYTGIAQSFINNDGRVWSDFTASEMKNHLRCSEYYQRAEQTIHDQDAWKEMRRTYVRVVGADASTVGPPESSYNGFSRPYEVGHNSYGRGIYAKVDIPKGSLVWHNIRSATFSEGMQFREFVMTLPPELGCDVLQWSYVMDEKIYCDLDEGSFCNNGYSGGSNIDIDEEVSEKFIAKAGMQLFAARDIKEGEELLCNYASFSDGDWGLFGL